MQGLDMSLAWGIKMHLNIKTLIIVAVALLIAGEGGAQVEVLKKGKSTGAVYQITNSADEVTLKQASGTMKIKETLFHVVGTYTDLAGAISAIGGADALLYLDGAYSPTASSRDTLPANISLKIGSGAYVSLGRKWTVKGYIYDPGTVNWIKGNKDSIEFVAGSVDYVRPEWFGGKTSTDINRAINAGWSFGNATTVRLMPGEYTVSGSPIILKNFVKLVGDAQNSTVIKVADGADVSAIQTENFSTLTGSNKWYVDLAAPVDSVIQGFEIRNLTINGNKANNSVGSGIEIYGKRFIIDNVIIYNTEEYGLYTECSASGGQATYQDMPEAMISKMWIKNADRNGWQMLGPHDTRADNFYIVECDTGLFVGYDATRYSGTFDIGFAHIYSNNVGVYTQTAVRAEYLETESNYKEGIVITGARGSVINFLRSYKNDRNLGGKPYLSVVNGGGVQIGTILMDMENAISSTIGVDFETALNSIGSGSIYGYGNGIGLKVNSNKNSIRNLHVDGFSSVGGKGLLFGVTSSDHNDIQMRILDCDTALYVINQGARNRIVASIYKNAGQDGFVSAAALSSTNYLDILENTTAGAGGNTSHITSNRMNWNPGVLGSEMVQSMTGAAVRLHFIENDVTDKNASLFLNGGVFGVNIIDDSEAYVSTPWKIDLSTNKVIISNAFKLGDSGNLLILFGTGSPEGAITADVGSTYHRIDGGAGTSFYVKESGTGNTGWVAK